ncbi:MAG TPA: glycine zipper 2TM domain-containing protein [Noviherbaspirillum sp.]
MENTSSHRIHPLVAGAAVSVMLVSLTGVAAITGLIPTSHSTASVTAANAPVATSVGAAAAATSPAALVEAKADTEEPETSPKPAKVEKRSPAQTSPSPARRAAPPAQPPVAQAPAICHSCGRVESVQAIQQEAQPSGVGMIAGAVLGGVLGNQVGGGSGRKVATVAGAVGGGYAGNEIEKRTRSTTTYQVRVRMEDGDVRTFPFAQQPGWSTGDRVRVVNGQLTSRA